MFFDKFSRRNEQNNDIVDYSFLQTKNSIVSEDGKIKNNSQKGDLILISGTPEVLGPPTRSHWKVNTNLFIHLTK